MLPPEKYFTVDHVGRHSEESCVERAVLDCVVEHAALARRVILEARRRRAGLGEHALDNAGILKVQLALPEAFIHEP